MPYTGYEADHDDGFDKLRRELGEPENAVKVNPLEAWSYKGKVPDALIQFWINHGRGSYMDGLFSIIDPKQYKPVVEALFADDPEFDARDFVAVTCGEVAEFNLWNWRTRSIFSVALNLNEFNELPEGGWIDEVTGKRFSDDYIIGAFVCRQKYFESWPLVDSDGNDVDENGDDIELLPLAIKKLGRLKPGEIYGFVPAIQIGGDNTIESIQKVDAVSHMLYLLQLEPIKLMNYRLITDPNPRKVEFIRFLGKKAP